MKKITSYCGLLCNECGAYIATRKNDDKMRKEIAEQWSKQYHAEIKPVDINCDSCLSRGDTLFSYCNECKIRACAQKRGVTNCAYCEEFPCKLLLDFHEYVPEAKKRLEEIHKK